MKKSDTGTYDQGRPWTTEKGYASSIPGLLEERFTAAGDTRSIFRTGKGPGVIVMHELPGLTRETVALANEIAAQDFHVVMPLLFGEPLQRARSITLRAIGLCVRHEFNCLRANRPSRITDWLRPLCAMVHRECGGPGIGVIGMCFSGGFVLTMMLEESVIAPVCAQPSLPFRPKAALDIDTENLERVVARADKAPLLALRFEADSLCPKERLTTLEAAFDDPRKFRKCEVPGGAHSTLVYDYGEARANGVDTRAEVMKHLLRQLRAA